MTHQKTHTTGKTDKQNHKIDCLVALAKSYSWTCDVDSGANDTAIVTINRGSRASRTYRIDTEGIVSVVDDE